MATTYENQNDGLLRIRLPTCLSDLAMRQRHHKVGCQMSNEAVMWK